MKKTIEVTQEMIDEGDKGMCQNCPIALALNQALFVNDISVLRTRFYRVRNVDCVGNLPFEAQNFIEDFDRDKKVSPFSFEVEVPWL